MNDDTKFWVIVGFWMTVGILFFEIAAGNGSPKCAEKQTRLESVLNVGFKIGCWLGEKP